MLGREKARVQSYQLNNLRKGSNCTEPFRGYLYLNVQRFIVLDQGWWTCGPRAHLLWSASEFSLPRFGFPHESKKV